MPHDLDHTNYTINQTRRGQDHPIVTIEQLIIKYNAHYICLRSRPVTPDVVRQLVSQLVSSNVERKMDTE